MDKDNGKPLIVQPPPSYRVTIDYWPHNGQVTINAPQIQLPIVLGIIEFAKALLTGKIERKDSTDIVVPRIGLQ
jgi:hypothetical protein